MADWFYITLQLRKADSSLLAFGVIAHIKTICKQNMPDHSNSARSQGDVTKQNCTQDTQPMMDNNGASGDSSENERSVIDVT